MSCVQKFHSITDNLGVYVQHIIIIASFINIGTVSQSVE